MATQPTNAYEHSIVSYIIL